AVAVAGDAHCHPPEGALLDVLANFQPELGDIEVKSLVLVENHDGGDVQLDHRLFSPYARFDKTLRPLHGVGLILSLCAVAERPDVAIGVRERPAIPAPLQLRRGLEDLRTRLLGFGHDLVDALFATDDVIKDETAEAVAVSSHADHVCQSVAAIEADERTAVRDEEDGD